MSKWTVGIGAEVPFSISRSSISLRNNLQNDLRKTFPRNVTLQMTPTFCSVSWNWCEKRSAQKECDTNFDVNYGPNNKPPAQMTSFHLFGSQVYLLPDKSKGGKRKTKVKKHTLNPIFDETLKYYMPLSSLESRSLWLTVWHSDMFGRNDFLGEVTINLQGKVFDNPHPQWYSLQERVSIFRVNIPGRVINPSFCFPERTIRWHRNLSRRNHCRIEIRLTRRLFELLEIINKRWIKEIWKHQVSELKSDKGIVARAGERGQKSDSGQSQWLLWCIL